MTAEAARTVLVVDDDADIRAVLEGFFAGDGWRVLEAESQEEALLMAQHEYPDLIMLDVMMRHNDEGYTTFAELRSHPETAHIPVIMLSAINDFRQGEDHSAEGMAARLGVGPPDAFLEKPVDPVALAQAVAAVLR